MMAFRHVKTRYLFFFCMHLALLLCQSGWAQPENNGVGGVLISPTNYHLQSAAGRKGTLSLTVANPSLVASSTRLTVRSSLPEDWTYRPQYDVQHPRDASAWFTERDLSITLAPGTKKMQSLKFSVPPRTSGSYWCIIQCNAKPVGSRSTANVIIDVPVLFTIGRAARPLLKISSPVMEKQGKGADSPFLLKFPVQNDGAGYAIFGVSSKLRNVVSGTVVKTIELDKTNLFPETKRYLQFRMPPIPDGNYALEFRAQVGSRLLPAVVSRYVIVKGEPKPETAATILELPPLTFEPSSISLIIPAGSLRSQSLRISNLSDRDITVDLAARSLEQTSSGVLGLGSETLPSGLSVTVTPASLTIRPKSTGSARVSLKADREAQGDLWFGLAVTERGNPNALPETINGSVSVAGTAKPMLEVVNGTVDIVGGRPLGVRFVVRNSGNQALQLVPSAAVLEDGIKLVSRLTVPVEGSGGILPGVELQNLTMLPPDLEPGEYIVEISYQYGEDLYAKLRVPIKVDESKTDESKVKSDQPTAPMPKVTQPADKTSQKAKP